MCTVDSGSVKPRLSHKTVWCTCFLKNMTFISIYRLRFVHVLSICYVLCWALQNTIILKEFFRVAWICRYWLWFFLLSIAKHFPSDSTKIRNVKRRIEQKNKWFFMQINYLCISYVLFIDIFTIFFLFQWNFQLLYFYQPPRLF